MLHLPQVFPHRTGFGRPQKAPLWRRCQWRSCQQRHGIIRTCTVHRYSPGLWLEPAGAATILAGTWLRWRRSREPSSGKEISPLEEIDLLNYCDFSLKICWSKLFFRHSLSLISLCILLAHFFLCYSTNKIWDILLASQYTVIFGPRDFLLWTRHYLV